MSRIDNTNMDTFTLRRLFRRIFAELTFLKKHGGGGGGGGGDTSDKADVTTTIKGVGSLGGGGDLSADRTLDLTQNTKDDIALGVTAHGWGDHATAGYLTTHQDITGKEDKVNKVQDLTTPNATTYPSTQAVDDALLKNVKDIVGGAEVLGHAEANSILEKQITENVSGTYTFDPYQASNFMLTMTGTTSFNVVELPADRTVVFSVILTGEHSFSFSEANLLPSPNNDVYDGSIANQIVVNMVGSFGIYTIKNLM